VKQQSTEVDLGNLNTSHSLAILSVPPGSRVLDLAAGDAAVARRMTERGCTVWAVAADPVAADAVRQVCDRVFVGDLEGDDVWQALGDERFDVALALDTLDHLRAPPWRCGGPRGCWPMTVPSSSRCPTSHTGRFV
jgi:2-polyprenyl-3-methyl-5-hydroxy-6-metoxy-1,4-benzoquinol methylase